MHTTFIDSFKEMSPIITPILVLITNIVSIFLTYHWKRKEFNRDVENAIKLNNKITVYNTREKMLEHLYSMYEKAQSDEIIWGQSVSGNIYGDVDGKIVQAAARGVKFKMIFSSNVTGNANLKKELEDAIKIVGGEIRNSPDNDIRIQGLSDKEVVIAFRSYSKYMAILIEDTAVVKVFYEWFTNRFNTLNTP